MPEEDKDLSRGERWRSARTPLLALLGYLSVLLVPGCVQRIPRINPAVEPFASLPETEISDLQRGRREYIAKCSGCHGLYAPSAGSAEYWRHWVEAMRTQVQLTEDEIDRITGYLVLTSELPIAGAPGQATATPSAAAH